MLKLLLTFFLLTLSSQAIVESQIQKVMDTKVHQVLSILKNPSLSQKQKIKKSITIMDPVFDYQTMAMISLGKTWKTLSSSQKKSFTKAFEQKLKRSYVDKLRLYKNQRVVIKPLKKIKPTRITLENDVIGKSETFKVKYHFFKNKKNAQWYIYDVHLSGVSIVQTYRKQFASFLKTKSFQALLKSL